MTNYKALRIWTTSILLFVFCLIPIEAKLDVPVLHSRIMDQAQLFSSKEKYNLESQILAFEKNNPGAQIAVLTIESLEGENLESYALKGANNWGLGSKEKNDGILILVAMKERAIRIEVGIGLENIITDNTATHIIANHISPKFKQQLYYAGIRQGIDAISSQMVHHNSEPMRDPKEHLPYAFSYVVLFFMFELFTTGRGSRAWKDTYNPALNQGFFISVVAMVLCWELPAMIKILATSVGFGAGYGAYYLNEAPEKGRKKKGHKNYHPRSSGSSSSFSGGGGSFGGGGGSGSF